MDKILVILPESIGGRLTTSSIKDGFIQNGFCVDVFDELYKNDLNFDFKNYKYIVGYDFSPVKFKIDNNLKIPAIAYFSDVIQEKTSGIGYLEYYKYLKNDDIFVFYWDRELAKKENLFYLPHFVNCEIYKELKPLSKTSFDISFMGRLDTKIRLETYLNLNKHFKNLKFSWHAIEKHYIDAYSRCENDFEKEILKNTYKGFIDNENDMAEAINNTKIIYNIDLLAYLLNNDQNLIQYFSLGLLFIISLVESILCISIVYNELKKLNIQIIMENLNTWYFEFLFIFCFILCLVFKFINFNIHFILFLLCLVILIPSFINFLKIYKHKNLFFIILGTFYIFSLVPINLYLNSTFIPILLLFPFFILEFAILCQKMYNQAKEKKK